MFCQHKMDPEPNHYHLSISMSTSGFDSTCGACEWMFQEALRTSFLSGHRALQAFNSTVSHSVATVQIFVAIVAAKKVKNSDSKKWRRALKEQYVTMSEAQLELVWPKSEGLTVRKLPNRVLVYYCLDQPLFYTTDAKSMSADDLKCHPTLYLLHAAPQLLPPIAVYDGLPDKLKQGTEIFMPGVVLTEPDPTQMRQSWVMASFGRFQKGEVRAVVEQSAWYASAIVMWAFSSDELEMKGNKGKAFDAVHFIGDHLWNSGNKKIAESCPASAEEALKLYNDKITEERLAREAVEQQQAKEAQQAEDAAFAVDAPRQIKRKQKTLRQIVELRVKVEAGLVVPTPEQQERLSRESVLSQEIADIETKVDRLQHPEKYAASDASDMDGQPSSAIDPGTSGTGATSASAGVEADSDTGASGTSTGEEVQIEVSMDDMLEDSLLLALKTTVRKKDLPMLVSVFYAQHIKPASQRLRTGVELNLKQTRFKKLGAFLDHMAIEGLVKVATEKAGVQKLMSFDSVNSRLLSFDQALYPEIEDEGADSGGTVLGQQWDGTMPKRGSKFITISMVKKKGNKNITCVDNLENFGITMDESLKRAISRQFSVSASYGMGPDVSKGTLMFVQGKYVVQLVTFLSDNLKIPRKHFVENAKGVSKKDKAVNV